MNLLLALATETEPVSSSFSNALSFWKADGFNAFLQSLFGGVIIIIIGWIALLIIGTLLKSACKRSKNISDLMGDYINKIVNVIGWIIILSTFLQHLGVDMGPMIAGLGVTGVILGFAFQDSLANFFAGSMIILNEPFRAGDYIEVGTYAGTVVKMDLMCLTLNTPDGKRITMSNKVAWASPIVNYSYTTRRGVTMTASVSYDTDLSVAKQVIIDMLASYPEVLKDPVPIVEVSKLNDSSIDFMVRPWVAPADYWAVYWRFTSQLVAKFAEKGISVPYPQVDVHVDGALAK